MKRSQVLRLMIQKTKLQMGLLSRIRSRKIPRLNSECVCNQTRPVQSSPGRPDHLVSQFAPT